MAVAGLDKLKVRLAKAGTTIMQAASPALLAAAGEVVAMAQRLVPVESGKLRASIKHGPVHEGRNGKSLVVTVWAGDETTVVGNNPKFQLSRLVEFGTVKTPAQAYFFPAYRLVRKRAQANIRKSMREAIKQV